MDSIAKLAGVRRRAKAAERRLIDVILQDPEAASRLSIHCLAEKADVSYATVCRLFPKAGFDGFKGFRQSLAQDLARAEGNVKRPEIAANQSAMEIRASFCALAERVIESCRANLDTEALESAARAILQARYLCFVGQGTSATTARYAYTKLFRLGIPCAWGDDAVMELMRARLMGEGQVLFAVSSSGRTRAVLECVKLAHSNGATVISLCDYKESPLSRAADISIYTTARDIRQEPSEEFPLMLAHTVVLDILYACCYARMQPAAKSYFDETRSVADREQL